MKKAVLLACALGALLCGCAAAEPAWETVDDTIVQDTGSYLDSAYTMLFDVPADALAATVERYDGVVLREIVGDAHRLVITLPKPPAEG